MFMPRASLFSQDESAAIPAAGRAVSAGVPPAGLHASALVETAGGWRRAGSLMAGERVQTWDGGLAEIARVERRILWPGAGLVHVPGGALGNCAGLWLAPDQLVMIAAPEVEEVLDAAGALIPARTLAGFRGCGLQPASHPARMIGLAFAAAELVYANSGALVLCPAGNEGGEGAAAAGLPVLDGDRARAMLDLIGGAGPWGRDALRVA